eukprot:CAMPEP_0184855076 /NCGR_PEP_ID=MMETSP0580-20130426/403_1 /TAXON_ID=1118495 /ORGANISM="Dactyliosolen fragilissimus" /LENGTH=642 /DNA_ID=CAMNT_0027349497 /DNA_START=181 /DNA_END=2109 /DNA_ORIENTATION=-
MTPRAVKPQRVPSNLDDDEEAQVDYDQGATELYQNIENKDWDKAISRIDVAPQEARTWVFRRENEDTSKMRWRLLPIHAVCVFRSPLAVIEALIKAYPDGTQMRDDQGTLPIHLACRNGASKGVVLTLLNAFPNSIRVKDHKGRNPIDLVQISSSHNRELVLQCVRRFENDLNNGTIKPKNYFIKEPQENGKDIVDHIDPSVFANLRLREPEVDYENRTMLFRLVLKKEWSGTIKRVSTHPSEASTWIVTKGFNGDLRFLPMHKACVLAPPDNVVKALQKAFPDALTSTDQDGWLPLHCACFYNASVSVINILLNGNSKAAGVRCDEGRMPLHYACLKGAKEDVICALIGANAKSTMTKDDEGRLPIHHACSRGAPDGTISALLKASPKTAQSKDDQGRLPLHHACRKNASESVVRVLLKTFAKAAQAKDDQEKLPIHYACQNCTNERIINLLLHAYPNSIFEKSGFGYTPLAEAKAVDDSKMNKIVKSLENFKKEFKFDLKDMNKVVDPDEEEEKEKKRKAQEEKEKAIHSKIDENMKGNEQLLEQIDVLNERMGQLDNRTFENDLSLKNKVNSLTDRVAKFENVVERLALLEKQFSELGFDKNCASGVKVNVATKKNLNNLIQRLDGTEENNSKIANNNK